MEIIIIILIGIIIAGGLYFLKERKNQKRIIAGNHSALANYKILVDRKEIEIQSLKAVERNYLKLLDEWMGFKNYLVDAKFEAETRKRELELIAARYDMEKMDDGVLFRLVSSKHKMSRTLMRNWLPYGQSLGELELMEKLFERFN